MNLKRLWDTENKKTVWAMPTVEAQAEIGRILPLQVWTNDDWSKLYVYANWLYQEISPSGVTVETYWPVWKSLEDETVGYYLTNEPTNLFNRDEWEDVAYAFKNWTTTLQSGKLKEWETPEYTGATPTKAADAQYTYTFSGWKPTVGPIYKKTDFKAQFDKTVNEYDLTIVVNDDTMGSVDVAFVEWQPYGTAISAEANVLTIGEGESKTVVTATAETGYVFSSWGTLPSSVSADATITATFEAEWGWEK